MDAEDQTAELRVVAYSGYQGEQEPRALYVDGERLEVVAIDDRWYSPGARYFRLRLGDGGGYLLRYDLETLSWSRVAADGSPRTRM